MTVARERTLKPCPFCGAAAEVRELMGREYIDCDHSPACLVAPSTWLSGDQPLFLQIRSWNGRVNTNKQRRKRNEPQIHE